MPSPVDLGGVRPTRVRSLVAVAVFLLAALAGVPAPKADPMPVWLTISIGFADSLIGGGISAAMLGANKDVSSADYFTVLLSSILAATVLIILYRRFEQLDRLHDEGVLTDEEYVEKRRQILRQQRSAPSLPRLTHQLDPLATGRLSLIR